MSLPVIIDAIAGKASMFRVMRGVVDDGDFCVWLGVR